MHLLLCHQKRLSNSSRPRPPWFPNQKSKFEIQKCSEGSRKVNVGKRRLFFYSPLPTPGANTPVVDWIRLASLRQVPRLCVEIGKNIRVNSCPFVVEKRQVFGRWQRACSF